MIESSKQAAIELTSQNNDINMQELITIIRRDRVNSNQNNSYVHQTFETYHVNKIKNQDLYDAIFHDLFEDVIILLI